MVLHLHRSQSEVPSKTSARNSTSQSITTGSTGDLRFRCNELVTNANRGNQGVVPNPLLQMTSKEVSSQGTSSVETSTLQFTNLATRTAELRRGASGVSLMGIALHDLEKTPPSRAIASLWPGQDRATVGDVGA